MQTINSYTAQSYAAVSTMALRWVIGWTYFSAFWRRLILDNKLIPEEAGYIGEKFNHFLPNALGIKPVIEYLVSNPNELYYAMVIFTVVEAIVGFFLILGLFTRIMSIAVFFLAIGILLGSGWLGTTCLDEWQIGVLGVAGGFTLFLTGSAEYSIDGYLIRKKNTLSKKNWFRHLASGPVNLPNRNILILTVSLGIAALTLFTNQYFHGGVFGSLHNKSISPKVEISNIYVQTSTLNIRLFRVEGADVYGSFLIKIDLFNEKNEVVKSYDQKYLSTIDKNLIHNYYVAKIHPGKHSLVLPLGAKADLKLEISDLIVRKGYSVKLTDISGITWSETIK